MIWSEILTEVDAALGGEESYPIEELPAKVREVKGERDRFREHSRELNSLSWRLAQAVGDVVEGETTEIDGDPFEMLDRLVAERDRLRVDR